jgi:hypothetical protein
MQKKKIVIGLTDKVSIKGKKGTATAKALFDTGATRTSVDMFLAAKVGLGPIVKAIKVRAASNPRGNKVRIVAVAHIKIKGKTMRTEVSIEDRSNLPYPILIGRDLIHSNFIIDVERTHHSNKCKDVRKTEKI